MNMFAFWLNRASLPFPALIFVGAATLVGYLVWAAQRGELNLLSAILIVLGSATFIYLLRLVAAAVSPYRLRIDDDGVAFPARVSSQTFQWWQKELGSAGLRFLVVQEFELAVDASGVSGKLKLPSGEVTVVSYPREKIESIGIRDRGLSELEVSVVLSGQPEPFVARAQTLGWPFPSRDRMRAAIQRLDFGHERQ